MAISIRRARSGLRGEIRTGYTCNVLLRRASPYVAGRRFNSALGRTGGEDTEYFSQLHEAGGMIAFAPEAWAYEPVPENRTRFSWLTKRRFSVGQTHGRLARQVLRHATDAAAGRACRRPRPATVSSPSRRSPVSPGHRNRYLLRGIMHAGVVSGLPGVREIRLYGHGTERRMVAMQPDVSFVIAAFNAEATIARAIESASSPARGQCRGGRRRRCSSDRTAEIARAFPEELVRVVDAGPRIAVLAAPATWDWTPREGAGLRCSILTTRFYPDRLARMIGRAEAAGAAVAVDNLEVSQEMAGPTHTMFPRSLLEEIPEISFADFIASNIMFE